jgi:hypothetical protein
LLLPVMLNPKRFVCKPKLASPVCTCGFHSTAGRLQGHRPQPAVHGK